MKHPAYWIRAALRQQRLHTVVLHKISPLPGGDNERGMKLAHWFRLT